MVWLLQCLVLQIKEERARTHNFNELSSGMGLATKMASSDVCVWFCSLRLPGCFQTGNDWGWLGCPKQSALAASEKRYYEGNTVRNSKPLTYSPHSTSYIMFTYYVPVLSVVFFGGGSWQRCIIVEGI